MPDQTHYTLEQYTNPKGPPPVFLLRVRPSFSPLDINIAFLARTGWLQSSDRLRFHHESAAQRPSDHPLGEVLREMQPHLLIRRLDRAEDSFASVHITIDGEVTVFSNGSNFARSFFAGVFLDCPPSFHTWDDVEVVEEWVDEAQVKAMFAGLLAGALGWDPSHNIPDNIQDSLDEAHKSLEIANYRSCVVMSRRTLEGVLKFGFRRLLGREPTDRRGHSLMLNAMIQEFRNTNPPPIPEHLLYIADSLRLIGNVPGAHAAEIKGYQFSRSDAEFAFYATHYFLEQYFSKIDQEVTQYYTLTIDLSQPNDTNKDS
jgi:Domain of unknown function (DUF4145)